MRGRKQVKVCFFFYPLSGLLVPRVIFYTGKVNRKGHNVVKAKNLQ